MIGIDLRLNLINPIFRLESGSAWIDDQTGQLYVRLQELWKLSAIQQDAVVTHQV